MPTSDPKTLKDSLAELEKDRCALPTLVVTLVVEGSDDECIYNWVPQALGLKPYEVKVVTARTKSRVLKMYEAVHKNRDWYVDVPIVFIADLDMYLFENIPPKYRGVVFTSGYSIENDLYSFTDLESLLDPLSEMENHRKVLDTIIEWFAFEIQEHRAGRYSKIARKLEDIVPKGETTMDPQFRKCRGFTSPCQTIHEVIKNDYKLKLRGKTLFDILVRFLSHKDREIRHSKRTLFENAFKNPTYPKLKNKFIDKIKSKIKDEKRKLAAHAPKRVPGPERFTIYTHSTANTPIRT